LPLELGRIASFLYPKGGGSMAQRMRTHQLLLVDSRFISEPA